MKTATRNNLKTMARDALIKRINAPATHALYVEDRATKEAQLNAIVINQAITSRVTS